MGIASSAELAAQHRDAIRNAASGLDGALEALVTVTNTNVNENIQNIVTASNQSVDEIRSTLEADADIILQIGEDFREFDIIMSIGVLGLP